MADGAPTRPMADGAPTRQPTRCAPAEASTRCASAEASSRCADEVSTRCADGASTSARFCSYYDGKRPATLVLSPGIAREETSCAGALARYGTFRAAPAGKALGALAEVPPYAPHGARCAPDNLRAAQARAGSWLLPSQLLAVLNAIAPPLPPGVSATHTGAACWRRPRGLSALSDPISHTRCVCATHTQQGAACRGALEVPSAIAPHI